MFIMLNEFGISFEKAREVNQQLKPFQKDGFVELEKIIDVVKNVSGYDTIKISFIDFDFDENAKRAGAMLSTKHDEAHDKKEAFIAVNTLNNDKVQRFSVVHELGHLITDAIHYEYETPNDGKFTVSTQINADITYISDEQCKKSKFLMAEQIANIFALLVLIPEEFTIKKLRENAEYLSSKYGVTIDALYSKMMLSASRFNEVND